MKYITTSSAAMPHCPADGTINPNKARIAGISGNAIVIAIALSVSQTTVPLGAFALQNGSAVRIENSRMSSVRILPMNHMVWSAFSTPRFYLNT